MSVLRFDLLTQSSDYTGEPVRGLETVWRFFLTWVLLKIEKNGIRIDVIGGAFNFLFLFFFSRYITVVTVLNMTCEGQPRPQGLLVFQFTCRRHVGTRLGSFARFRRKSPVLDSNLNNSIHLNLFPETLVRIPGPV